MEYGEDYKQQINKDVKDRSRGSTADKVMGKEKEACQSALNEDHETREGGKDRNDESLTEPESDGKDGNSRNA